MQRESEIRTKVPRRGKNKNDKLLHGARWFLNKNCFDAFEQRGGSILFRGAVCKSGIQTMYVLNTQNLGGGLNKKNQRSSCDEN